VGDRGRGCDRDCTGKEHFRFIKKISNLYKPNQDFDPEDWQLMIFLLSYIFL